MLAKLCAADSSPGVLDVIGGTEYYLVGGHPEDDLQGEPGTILARRDGAICRATSDGAVWIPQLRQRPAPGGPKTFKLPATLALRGCLDGVPEVPAPLATTPGRRTYREICYRESGDVGYMEFSFPGGAMNTGQCRRLLAAYRYAQSRPVKVIVLGGPRDFFSNGIHLNVIQVAADPAEESWQNINAMNDLVEAIMTTTGQLTVAALAGNAAAGGLMLALAADQVWCRDAAVLNPHYKLMGLHGSEYWTYTLPRRSAHRRQPGSPAPACRSVPPPPCAQAWSTGSSPRRGRLPRAGGGPGRGAGRQPRLPGAAGRKGPAARRGRETAAASRYRAAELAIMRRNFSVSTSHIPTCAGPSSTAKSHCAHRLTWPGTGVILGPPAPAKPGHRRGPRSCQLTSIAGRTGDPSPSSRRVTALVAVAIVIRRPRG